MKLPSYVLSRPKILNVFPLIRDTGGQTVYPFIFLKPVIFTDLMKEAPNPKYIALFYHEQKHRNRQKELGVLFFGIRYIFSRRFRFQEELAAYRITLKIYKQNSLTFDIEKISRALSGPLYLWSTSYREAKEELINAWGNL